MTILEDLQLTMILNKYNRKEINDKKLTSLLKDMKISDYSLVRDNHTNEVIGLNAKKEIGFTINKEFVNVINSRSKNKKEIKLLDDTEQYKMCMKK